MDSLFLLKGYTPSLTVRHGYMRMQAQENTDVQQRGVPTTSQRTEELKQKNTKEHIELAFSEEASL